MTNRTLTKGDIVAFKASLWPICIYDNISVGQKSSNTSSLINFVTDFELTYCKILNSVHLKQLAIICPNLQRLSLFRSKSCLKSLKDLRAVSDCCRSLKGVNLLGTHVSLVENHLVLWEILSDMNLTYFTIDLCILTPFEDNDVYKRSLLKIVPQMFKFASNT